MSTLMHENGHLRDALKRIIERCEIFIDDEADMRTHSIEVLMGIAEDALSLQAEPECRDWIEDFEHDNGNYLCRCCHCDEQFAGHKRRVVCKVCDSKAEPAPAQDEREAPTVVATAILGGLFHGDSGPELGEIDIEVCTSALEKIQCETVNSSDDAFLPLMTVAQHERIVAALTRPAQTEQQPELTVWEGAMPESNGKSNFTAVLMRKGAGLLEGISGGMTIARSEYPDRVRYEADCVRWLIGEMKEEPCITDYDADKHSGYAAPIAQSTPQPTLLVERLVEGLDEISALTRYMRQGGCDATDLPGLEEGLTHATTIADELLSLIASTVFVQTAPQPEQSGLVAALEQFADDSNWCYDTCNISRDVAKDALASYRSTQGGDA